MTKRYLLLAALTLASLSINQAFSGERNNGVRKNRFVVAQIDGQPFTSGQLVADFLNVAISDRVWDEDLRRDKFELNLSALQQSTNSQYLRDELNKHDKWLAPYVLREDNWPKSSVINKWQGEITVAIGRPDRAKKDSDPAMESIVEDQVTAVLPAIRTATGHEIRFVKAEGDPGVRRPDAAIRIIFDEPIIPPYGTEAGGGPFNWEQSLWGAFLFEDSDKENFRGYLLPSSDNTLGLVICKLRHDTALLRGLVTRCLLRAMGLPGLSESPASTALGKVSASTRSSGHEESERGLPSAYDLKMLSILYCAAVKPGMSKNQVIQVLAAKNECSMGP
jgi:hypothetical protein